MVARQDKLYEQVSAYEHPNLIERMVEKEGMEKEDAVALFGDLKRFLYLCMRNDTQKPLAPTEMIDTIWHNFILFTEDYRKFCEKYFNGFIHHRPLTSAEVSASDGSMVRNTREFAELMLGADLSENWQYFQHPGSCGFGVCGASTNCQGVSTRQVA